MDMINRIKNKVDVFSRSILQILSILLIFLG